jgi:hypothetical protein
VVAVFLFFLQFLVEIALAFELFRDDRAVLPEGAFQGLLAVVGIVVVGGVREFEGDFLLLEGDDAVAEAVGEVVPDALGL